MKLTEATIKSVKADLDKERITVTFSIDLSQLEDAQRIAQYVGQDVTIIVEPRQLPLLDE